MALAMDDEGNFYEDEYSTSNGTTARFADAGGSPEEVASSNASAESWWDQWISSGAGEYAGLSETMSESVGYNYSSGPTNPTKVAEAGGQDTEERKGSFTDDVKDKLTGIGDWVSKNPKTADVILGMIAAAAKGQSDREVADRTARGRIEEQNNADRLKQEDVKRVSDSVTGIKRAQRGLIPQYLRRKDGSRVFGDNGKLAGA